MQADLAIKEQRYDPGHFYISIYLTPDPCDPFPVLKWPHISLSYDVQLQKSHIADLQWLGEKLFKRPLAMTMMPYGHLKWKVGDCALRNAVCELQELLGSLTGHFEQHEFHITWNSL